MIRKLIPVAWKLRMRLLQRRFSDWKQQSPLATSKGALSGKDQIFIRQTIKRTSLFENKVHNLQLASQRLTEIVVQPNEVLSFWKTVGNPSESNGYKTGRNIVNGTLQEAVGGGLCQLSGIIYHTSLVAGFPVVERYNHTIDIYKEEDRFTPLGADATVVYGYKDLRIRNHLNVPIQFVFSFEEEHLTCAVRSEQNLESRNLLFKRFDRENGRREVQTIDVQTEALIARSDYQIPS